MQSYRYPNIVWWWSALICGSQLGIFCRYPRFCQTCSRLYQLQCGIDSFPLDISVLLQAHCSPIRLSFAFSPWSLVFNKSHMAKLFQHCTTARRAMDDGRPLGFHKLTFPPLHLGSSATIFHTDTIMGPGVSVWSLNDAPLYLGTLWKADMLFWLPHKGFLFISFCDRMGENEGKSYCKEGSALTTI